MERKFSMKVPCTFIKGYLAPLLLLLFLLPLMQAAASPADIINYVASSTHYKIGEDIISSGSVNAASTGYGIYSGISDLSSEISTSSSFSAATESIISTSSNPFLSISMPSNVSLSPAISTSGGGVGNGSASWTVTTNNPGGYVLSVRAGTDPALESATDSFGNYQTQAAGVPDYNFAEGANANYFGFTPEGGDIVPLYKDDGVSLCNTGSSDTTDRCWDSMTTIDKIVARRVLSNNPAGTVTTLKFRAEAGSLIHKTAGSYSATITVTALAL